jgi:hypothetical protein
MGMETGEKAALTTRQRVAELQKQGLSLIEIARIAGVSKQRVCQILQVKEPKKGGRKKGQTNSRLPVQKIVDGSVTWKTPIITNADIRLQRPQVRPGDLDVAKTIVLSQKTWRTAELEGLFRESGLNLPMQVAYDLYKELGYVYVQSKKIWTKE